MEFFEYCSNYKATKILIVDDEPNYVRVLEDRLKMNEYTVVTASNGEEGLKLAAVELPDIILLDVVMPVMDGHEMYQELRNTPGCKDIAVIMLTGSRKRDDIQKAENTGILHYITKPFEFNYLLEKIELIIDTQENVPVLWRSK